MSEEHWKKKAFALRDLLDNIDTADDACRSDDAGFRERARQEVMRADLLLLSLDGQTWVEP